MLGYAMCFLALGSALTVRLHSTRTNLPQYLTREIGDDEFEELLRSSASAGHKWHVEQFVDGSRCYVPETEQNMAPVPDDLLERGIKLVEEATVGKKLEYLPISYWGYKFINSELNKTVIQHKDQHQVLLGSMVKADPQTVQHSLERDEDSYYISERFGDGDLCSLLEEDRTVEVQYRCKYDTPLEIILDLKEYETCRYTMLVSIPSLCELPEFGPYTRQTPANTIYCTAPATPEFNIATLVEAYKPTFLGHGFYHLAPHANLTHKETTAMLMYHQQPIPGNEEDDGTMDSAFIKHSTMAYMQLLEMGLLNGPDGLPFSEEGNFTVYAKVIGFDGGLITVTRFQISHGEVIIDHVVPEVLEDMEQGNSEDYEQQAPEQLDEEEAELTSQSDDPAIMRVHLQEFITPEYDAIE